MVIHTMPWEDKQQSLVIVIPAFNETGHLQQVVSSVEEYAKYVIIVDDGSKIPVSTFMDDTSDKVKVLRHKINLGKGAAMKTGVFAAKKLGADIVLFMDADGQHKGSDIKKFIEAFSDPSVDVVFGSRIIGKDMPLIKMLGNKFLSIATSVLFGIYVSDTQSGFRAFRMRVTDQLIWNSTRYSVETEMITLVGKKKISHKEIEIETVYHDKYKGTTIIDGIRIFFNMLIWKFL